MRYALLIYKLSPSTYISIDNMCRYFKKLFRKKHRRELKHKHLKLVVLNKCVFEKGHTYKVTGEIKMAGIGKAVLNMTITAPAGEVSPSVVETNDDGAFELSFVANSTGVYTILVEFVGDAVTLASSATLMVDVLPLPPVPVASTITLVGPAVPVMVGDVVVIGGVLAV